jgi:hypothetical protein
MFQFHGFSDASEAAFAAVVYLRITSMDGSTDTNIVCSKSRVSPVKQLTIPKLELCGASLLARLLTRVKKSLDPLKRS